MNTHTHTHTYTTEICLEFRAERASPWATLELSLRFITVFYHFFFLLRDPSSPVLLPRCIFHARNAETPTVISLYGFSHNVFAASLLIMGLGGSFSPCCVNDDCRGGGAKRRRGGLAVLAPRCSAMQRVSPPPPSFPPSLSTHLLLLHHLHHHHHHPNPNKPQLSSPLNQSRCLFNYWEQRGSLTNSFSQPLIAPSLAFLSSSLCHSLRLDFSLCLPLLSSPSLFPPHLPCSLVSACSICLTVHFHFYGLQSLFQLFFFFFFLYPLLLLLHSAARQCHRHPSLGFSLIGARPPSIYLEEWAHPSLIVVKYYGGVTTTKPPWTSCNIQRRWYKIPANERNSRQYKQPFNNSLAEQPAPYWASGVQSADCGPTYINPGPFGLKAPAPMDVSETWGPVDTTISGTVGAIESSHAVMRTVLLLETHRHSDGQSEALYSPPAPDNTVICRTNACTCKKQIRPLTHTHGQASGVDGWVGGEGEREREKRGGGGLVAVDCISSSSKWG